jgi:hypothetical protein
MKTKRTQGLFEFQRFSLFPSQSCAGVSLIA